MQKVRDFLKKLEFIQSWEEMAPVEEAYLRQMKEGLEGRESCMPMIPAYLTADALPDSEQTVIVMDAGGTNLRTALIRVIPGQEPEVLYSHKRLMPGKTPITKKEFFLELAREVAPIADKSDRIGFCFSFPCKIRPDFDGEVLYMDKEITIYDIEGALVGQGLKEALADLGCAHDQKIVILNDTVAALLGALAKHPAACYSGFIGMILGTGMNCCYSESNCRILKDETLKDQAGHSIINMESGNFNDMPITEADRMLSRDALVAGQNLAEKMMSGAYQGLLLDNLLAVAAREGLFSDAVCEKLNTLEKGFSAVDISAYMAAPDAAGRLHDLAPEGEDAQTLFALVDALLERAAMLAVMNLTGIMRATGTGTDPLRPVAIAIEGTTYEKNEALRMKIRAYLIDYTQRVRGYHCRVFATPDANMVGSAVAAMTL